MRSTGAGGDANAQGERDSGPNELDEINRREAGARFTPPRSKGQPCNAPLTKCPVLSKVREFLLEQSRSAQRRGANEPSPCRPPPPLPPSNHPNRLLMDENAARLMKDDVRRLLSPRPNRPSQTALPSREHSTQTFVSEGGVTRKATVSGPVQVMLELSKQLLSFAEAVTTALETRAELPPPRFLHDAPTEPTAVRDRFFLSPLMRRWLTGTAAAKVDLRGVNIDGKRVLGAVPAEPPKRRRTEKRYRFRTGSASLSDLQASQFMDAFEMWLPIFQSSNGELSQLAESMEKRKPGSGYRHLDECLEASSLLTSIAHARAYLRFRAWAYDHPPKRTPTSTCWPPYQFGS